jgi:Porin subfamily
MGALHDTAGQYYSTTLTTAGAAAHPGNEVGYAVGAGLKLNAPMFGQGDYFQGEVNYAVGASGYVMASGTGVLYGAFNPGGEYGFGLVTNAVYNGTLGSSLELTTAWGVNASYQHQWNSQWKTSVYGMYMAFNYTDRANTLMCAAEASVFTGIGTTATCNNDFSYWGIGSRTQWNVTKAFYMGVDLVYTKLDTGMSGSSFFAGASGQPAGTRTFSDQDAFTGYFRVHYDFLP